MATEDISRNATSFAKRYDGIRLQQGRVTTDDDYNEGARLDAEQTRLTVLDVVGPSGSPDSGFAIANPRINTRGDLDFDIAAGTLYLGGLRLECLGESYTQQVDWLEQPAADRAAPTDGRADLAYVMAWEQPVEAIEDSELFETALGGPDTATRLRLMRRIMLGAGLGGSDCATAWTDALLQIEATYGIWNPETCLCEPDTKLRVTFDNTGKKDDLCAPSVVGGYLGAENQAIRVQIVDTNKFTWGFDNASPLYRVTIGADRKTVTLQTEPKDQAHWMQSGITVEILAWSAVLPNGEKLAEISGHLTTVAGAYDPDLHTLTLTDALPAAPPPGFGEQWRARDDAATLEGETPYYFMRVWARGSDTVSPAAIAFMPGTAVALGNTGILVTLTGTVFVPADYWVIAARPEDPTRVVPWDLLTSRAPHGIRRYFAPIGQIFWSINDDSASGSTVDDCRPPFQPLTRRSTCCTFTVGDGVTSHGNYSVIQDAIDHLPPRGGCICILAGTFAQDFRVDGRRQVRIEGCGPRTQITGAPRSNHRAVVTIVDSSEIVLTDFAIANPQRIGLQLVDRLEAQALNLPADLATVDAAAGRNRAQRRLDHIHLHKLLIEGRDRSAVAMAGGRFIDLTESTIAVDALAADFTINSTDGRWPAVFIAADDVLVERNSVTARSLSAKRVASFAAASDNADPPAAFTVRSRLALGGIQIAGGSERVAIRRNSIVGGTGNGITLGSIAYVPERVIGRFTVGSDFLDLARQWTYVGPGGHLAVDENGCIQYVPDPPPPNGPDGGPMVPISTGNLTDILIKENEIADMGQSGIAVARFFAATSVRQTIIVDGLRILENRIRSCLQIELPEIGGALAGWAAYGAIALAAVHDLQIGANTIAGNGRSHLQPICGVFLLGGTGVTIDGNTVRSNGLRIESAGTAQPGLRGGLFLGLVTAPREEIGPEARPAARILDNVVVCEDGQALVIVAASGAVTVHRNALTSRGATGENGQSTGFTGVAQTPTAPGLAQPYLRFGSAVVIVDLGLSSEMVPTGSFGNSKYLYLAATQLAQTRGGVMFDDNQVLLDLGVTRARLLASSVLLISLDDVSAQDNQLTVRSANTLLLADLAVVAGSLRIVGNRLSETMLRCLLSGLGIGVLATASLNQSTHCLFVASLLGAAGEVQTDNLALIDAWAQAMKMPPICTRDFGFVPGRQ
ncbi:DUF6519 domain-containing protein [Reyranella sp.]|uniref:DUF6519 domain-containing protein n=1 Tax=Reyranella sp. TaxID=1929291 RepID=UPI003D0C0F30